MADEKPLQITDILQLLSEANKALETKFYVPSLPEEITLKALTAVHTKNIVKSAIDGPFSATQFTLVIFHVLKDVFPSPTFLETLNILDKNALLLQIRAKTISPNIEVQVYGQNEDNVTIEKKYNCPIVSLIDVVKADPKSLADQIIEVDNFKVYLNFPSIKEEYDFEANFAETRLKTVAEDDKKAIRSLAAPIFINNIAQFIKKVDIGDKSVDLKSRRVKERLDIVERLPSSIVVKALAKIEEVYGTQLNKLTRVETKISDIEYIGNFEINAELFITA